MIGSASPRAADMRVKWSQRCCSAERRSSAGDVRVIWSAMTAQIQPDRDDRLRIAQRYRYLRFGIFTFLAAFLTVPSALNTVAVSFGLSAPLASALRAALEILTVTVLNA